MSEIREKLQSLLAQKGVMSGAEWRRKLDDLSRRRAAGEFEIDKVVSGEVVGDAESGFFRVRTDFPLDTRHGSVTLGDVLEAIPEHIAFSACDPDLEDCDPSTALFLDTETTGLSGGTGTMAFLVGVGYFTENLFRLDQCFMRDFDDEEPMLRYLDETFKLGNTVVSYNGKSFDLPLLRTRFIQNRLPFRPDGLMHFDLLHAARRLYKTRLQDCGLGNIEQSVLGIQRHGDIPSEEIPEIWLSYLRTRDARRLDRVFYHHKMDVLSLVALTAWLSRSLACAADSGLEHVEDQLSLVRLHFRHRRYEDVVMQGRRLLEAEADSALRRECTEFIAFAQKRLGDWSAMEETLDLMLREFPHDLVARLELAKHHEHRTRDLIEAERICAETVQFLDTRVALYGDSIEENRRDAFAARLDRIRRKLARKGGGEEWL